MSDTILDGSLLSNNDSVSQTPNIDILVDCKSDLESLLFEYGNVLAPRIVEYEVERCEFPVEVLNEIRAIYAHIYRATVATNKTDAEGNLKKAKSHSKRAVLDCYKYLCVTYDNRYHEFFKKFDYINWTKSNLEEDIAALDSQRRAAVDKLKLAKTKESTEQYSGAPSSDSTIDYRDLYKCAYEEYVELMDMVANLENKILGGFDIVSKFPASLITAVGFLGIAVGVFLGIFL